MIISTRKLCTVSSSEIFDILFISNEKYNNKTNGGSGLQQLQSLGMLLSEETVFCAYPQLSSLAFSHGLNCNQRNGAHLIW